MPRDDFGACEGVRGKFVDDGPAGGPDATVAVTGDLTRHEIGGRRARRELYLQEAIPALEAFPSMAAGGDLIFISDPDGTVGWTSRMVFPSAEGKKELSEFTALKEKRTEPDRVRRSVEMKASPMPVPTSPRGRRGTA